MVKRDDEIKVLGKINPELQYGTYKVIENLSHEKVSQQKAIEKFKWKVVHDHESSMQDSNLRLRGDKPYSFFASKGKPPRRGLNPRPLAPEVAEEIIKMANDHAEELSSDQVVTDNCLDDEHVEERRPSKRIRVTQEEMVNDKKPKKGR
nr:hypothetical protein [Tanacetum cinerariifolium]